MMTKRPNILLLMSDQHQADMMGCAGDSYAQTPNIDRLAREGTRFARAYCQGPLCMPARVSLMTERFVRDHGVFENSSDSPPSLATFTQRLVEAGYHTAEIGKMHLWPHGLVKARRAAELAGQLTQLGFAEPIETVGKLASARYDTPYTDYLADRGLLDAYRAFIRAQHHAGGDTPVWDAAPGPIEGPQYVDTWHGDRTVSWIENYQSDQPFFLWVGFPGPHDPYDAPQAARARFGHDVPMPRSLKRPQIPADGPLRVFFDVLFRYSDTDTMTDHAIAEMRRAYYANIALIDDAVGRIVAALADRKMLDDTWIVYTSDHGEFMGERRMVAKMAFFEQAVRMPLIIRPPGGAPPRLVRDPVQLMDIAATFRDIAGADDIPESVAHSLRRAVEEEAPAPKLDVIVSENFGFAMFLKGRHKLVVYEDDLLPVQLFDLEDDPVEDHDLIADPTYADVVAAAMEEQVRPFFARKPLRPHPDIVKRGGRIR
jgi:arylsulfatase A-like enzyme